MSIVAVLAIGLIAAVLLFRWARRDRLQKRLARLRAEWGKLTENRLSQADTRTLFDLTRNESVKDGYQVDEESWHDLDLDELFTLLDRTATPVGAQFLYKLLRSPVTDREILAEREQLIETLASDQTVREQIQVALKRLDSLGGKNLARLLWSPLPRKPIWANYLPVLSLISIVGLGLAILSVIHFGWLIALFAVNFSIRTYVKRQIESSLYSFEFLAELIRTARELSRLKSNQFIDITNRLRENLRSTGTIEKTIFAVQYEDQFAIMDYINSYFLWDITGYYSALKRVERHQYELRVLFETVGYLDSLISIASFRKQFPNHSLPVFTSKLSRFVIEDIYNPLVSNPVTNCMTFEARDYIVTGSNMAGKTTFIKTLGVNALLVQTIHTCLASRYEAPLLRVISSISPADNLLEGKSYFMAEIESIHRLLRASETDSVHLLICDEIFRGTNSVERHAISIEVLNYLANNKDFVLVATHDMELSRALDTRYRNIHFEEQVDKSGLKFDYVVRSGPAITRNAIALLQQVGYPEAITQKAIDRVNES